MFYKGNSMICRALRISMGVVIESYGPFVKTQRLSPVAPKNTWLHESMARSSFANRSLGWQASSMDQLIYYAFHISLDPINIHKEILMLHACSQSQTFLYFTFALSLSSSSVQIPNSLLHRHIQPRYLSTDRYRLHHRA